MTDYAIRIRRSYVALEQFSKYLNEVVTKWVIYEHPEEGNVHIHGLLLGCSVSTDTLKNHVKAALNVKTFDRNDWAFSTEFKEKPSNIVRKVSEETSPKFITYMTKGKYEPKASKGFTIEYLEERRKAWETHDNSTKRQTPNKRVKKETHFDICMRIRERAKKRSALIRTADGDIITAEVFASFDNIWKLLMEELDNNKIRTSEYDMDRWLYTILRGDPMGESVQSKYRQKYTSKFEQEIFSM